MAAGYQAPAQGAQPNWLQAIMSGQTPGLGQIIPGALGLISGFFDSGRGGSLRDFAEDLIKARLTAQDNYAQQHAALAKQGFDQSIQARKKFHEGNVATAVRNLNQGISAHGAGPGSDTRNDVFNAVLASEGERAYNQDYDRLQQQYLSNLMQIENPDVQGAIGAANYAFPAGLYDEQQSTAGIDALVKVAGLIGESFPSPGKQPSQPKGGAQYDPSSYWDSIFDMQRNNNLEVKTPTANYLRWDTGGGMFG